jgi:hypothetical protein
VGTVGGPAPCPSKLAGRRLLDRIEGDGVRTVLVEDASRFARELMAQELGITLLISRGVNLITAAGDDLTASDDPSRKMMLYRARVVRDGLPGCGWKRRVVRKLVASTQRDR